MGFLVKPVKSQKSVLEYSNPVKLFGDGTAYKKQYKTYTSNLNSQYTWIRVKILSLMSVLSVRWLR